MGIDDVIDNIKLAEKVFRSSILSTNYLKEVNVISWPNYTPGIFKSLYAKEYERIIQNRQYSFLLKENLGCIQFYFYFENQMLRKMRLCYYPYPVGINITSEDVENHLADYNDEIIGEYYYDLYNLFSHQFELKITDNALRDLVDKARQVGNFEGDENLILGRFEDKYKFTNSSHIRIDYDDKVQSHHKCEIQMGGINNIRLPMEQIISPFTFCDFIIKNIDKTKHQTIVGGPAYESGLAVSKNKSVLIPSFEERNIFLKHM